MRCPTCGFQIDQDHLDRCPNCGNPLSTQATQAGQAAHPTAENPPPQQPPYSPDPHYPSPSGYGQYAPPSSPLAPGYPPPGYPPPPQGNYPQPSAYPPPPYYGYPQPFAPLTQQESGGGFAIAGLVLGIVSIPIAFIAICGYITAILGLIFSMLGRRAPAKRTMATFGVVLSVLGFLASIGSSMVGVMIGQRQYSITGSGSTFALTSPTAFGPTRATGTFSVSGSADDFISQGESYTYDTSKGDVLIVSASPTGSTLHIQVTGYNGVMWTLDFAAPRTVAPIHGKPAVLVPGIYNDAHRMPQNGNGPGLDLTGDSRGCNTVNGSFTIIDAVFGPPGYVQKFDATFVQHCEGGTSAASGQVHISNPPAG